jgi:hypothetical protein
MLLPTPPSSIRLPDAGALREEARRVSDRASLKGRPRRRFLTERRDALARALVPVAAVVSAITVAVALLDLLLSSFPPSLAATVTLAVTAIALAAVAAAAFSARGRYGALIGLAIAAGALGTLGWGLACRLTGGGASPFLLVVVLANAAFASVAPVPPRAAATIGACALAGVGVASLSSPAYAWLLALTAAAGSVIVARARHDQAVRTFRKVERIGAALSRMRRVQEQLVVVEKLEALRVLVGGMAHELNNALAVSQASNQQAARDLDKGIELARSALARSDGGLARIKRTVDRLRRFAMAAEGVLEPADVSAMLDFALESAIGRARSGVVVERVYDADVGAIECHVSALAEALFQIARNAIEAMPGGGTIEARVRREGDLVVLSVSDEGRGIPSSELARVFDPFFSRAPGKSASKSGLGLSAVYGLVTALGGRVDIQSEVGRGTVVSIAMPARKVTATKAPPR